MSATQQAKSKKNKGSSSKQLQANTLLPLQATSDTMVASHRHVTAIQPASNCNNSTTITEIASPPPANANRFSGPPHHHQGRLQSLYKDSKEEQFHIKTARAFFCLQNMVSFLSVLALLFQPYGLLVSTPATLCRNHLFMSHLAFKVIDVRKKKYETVVTTTILDSSSVRPVDSQLSSPTSEGSDQRSTLRGHDHFLLERSTFLNKGSECRVSMLKSYKNPRTPRKRTRHERTVFEGIFKTLSANQGELMLEASEEKLVNMKTGEERTVGICLEPCILRMNTVAHIKFVGKNITRNGIVSVPTKEDVELRGSKHRSVTYTIGTDDSVAQKEVSTGSGSLDTNTNKSMAPLITNAPKATSEKDDLQTGAVEQRQRDIDFPPFEGSKLSDLQASTKKEQPAIQHEDNLPSIDELLASKLRPSPLAQTNKNNNTDEKPSKKKTPSTTKKQLQRFKFEDGEMQANHKTLQESSCADSGTFDQFEGRKTDFSMDIYSVQMPDKVSPELQARANRLEKEIGQGRDEEQIFSMVDDDCQLRRRERQTEETLFGTAIQGDQKAQYRTVFDNTNAAKHENDGGKQEKEVVEANVDDRETNRNPSSSIKDILFKSLGALGQQPGDMEHLGLPLATEQQQDDMRSRNNSLRNGETSKVIENLDIEAPKMDKDQIEEYLRFKATMSSSKNQATGALARDRKLSQEYFQNEAKRLDKKLQEGKHLKTTQHYQSPVAGEAQQSTQTTKHQSPLQTIIAQEETSQPKKKFTCFKLRGAATPSVATAFGLYDKITTDID